MRCKEAATDLMCPRHEAEWEIAGSPALTQPAAAEPAQGDALTLAVPKALQGELATARGEAQAYLQAVADMPNVSDEDLALCADVVNHAKDRAKALDEQRKSVTAPLNEVVKTVNSWFKPPIEFWGSVKSLAGEKITQALAARDQQKREALAEIQAGAGEASAEAFAVVQRVDDAPLGVSVRRTLKYRVTDMSQVPEGLTVRVVNDDAIKALVEQHGMALQVPGIEVYEDVTVAAGRSK